MFQVMGAAFSQEGMQIFRVGNSLSIILDVVFSYAYLILCSKKVGNRTQTVVNSTEVAASEAAASRSLSRGFFVSIMILVTSLFLPF